MPKANPLKISEVKPAMEVAVYIPGLHRPLYGVVTNKVRTQGRWEIEVIVYRAHEKRTILVTLDQIVPW